MSLPIIAIVGRPNVGKSRLFNRLTGKFKALVDETSGVTRDRHYGYADWRGRNFIVVDTGGFIPGSEDPLNQKVWSQAFLAIQEADIILCLFDGQLGLTPVDEALVAKLRPITKPVLYLVNKIDAAGHEKHIADFARLRVEPLLPVSAEHGRGVADLLEKIYPFLKEEERGEPRQTQVLRLSIVGRPNVGKSTLLNRLARQERVVVHEAPGTTRDAIDVLIQRKDKNYVFVDTAGIKRKRTTKTRLEKFSVLTSLRAIEESQLVLLLLDATEGLTHQDLHLIYHIWNGGKGLMILVNKWDLVKLSTDAYRKSLTSQLGELSTVPILCISAKSGLGVEGIWNIIQRMESQFHTRVKKSQLNEWLEAFTDGQSPPLYRGRPTQLFSGTQVEINPPHILLFVNEPKGISTSYKRYLKNKLMDVMGLEGIPIRLTIRKRAR